MKNEIKSFNETVPEMSSLLDLEGADLDLIIGGALGTDCPNLTTCGTYGSCGTKGAVFMDAAL